MESTLRQRWDDYRLTKTQGFWIAVAAIAVVLVAGFGGAGWVTAGTLHEKVAEAAADARHTLATAVCVDGFMAADDARGRLAKLQSATWYERSELIAKSGWATMPDRDKPNDTVAGMCGARLAEMTAPAADKEQAALAR